MREMKDSGIEWIGQIPTNWDVVPHKRVMHKVKEICEQYNGEDIISLTMNGVIKRDLTAGGKMPTSFDGYQYVKPNDLLLCLFDIDVTPRCVGVVKDYGVTSPAYSRFVIHDGYYNAYYDYLLRAIDDDKVFVHLSKNLRSSLTENDFGAIKTCVPPLAEQERIAVFLNAECAEIDAVLEKTRASIEEYKKLKQAVITQAVTKGIRGDRPMKDSGIEWIGDIPAEWGVVPFSKFARVSANLVNPSDYQDYLQVSPENIEKDSGKLLPCKTVSEVGVESWNHFFHKGQILYSKIRPKLNKVCIAPFDGLCSADMYPIDTDNILKFVVYTILSNDFNQQVAMITENRVKMPKINQKELSKIIVVLPANRMEQQEIVDYLDGECGKIDALIAKKQQYLTEIENYKKSLIYEYVTGKKEVKTSVLAD